MRKGLKERFELHSFFFLMVMILGINMLVFLFVTLAEALLTGYILPGLTLLLAILAGFFIPLVRLRRRHPGRPWKKLMKSDAFLMAFSLSFITIGAVVVAGTVWYFFYA